MAKAQAQRGRGLMKGEGAWKSFQISKGRGGAQTLPEMEMNLSDSESDEDVVGGQEDAWKSDALFLGGGRRKRPLMTVPDADTVMSGDSTTTIGTRASLSPAEVALQAADQAEALALIAKGRSRFGTSLFETHQRYYDERVRRRKRAKVSSSGWEAAAPSASW